MNKKIFWGLTAGLTLVVMVAVAEPVPPTFEFVPSLWVAGLSGSGTLHGQDVKYDRSTGDLWEHLEAGGSLAGKVVWNGWALGGQLDGYQLSTDALTVNGTPLAGQMDTDLIFGELAAGRVFPGWKEGQTFTLALGFRYARIANDLDAHGTGSFHHRQDRWDPMIILWPSLPLLASKVQGLSLTPAFSIGGGGDSKLVYELFPQVRYQVTPHLVARAGYRAIGYRAKHSADELKFTLAGFIVGLGVTF
ncbi:MAG TPA: hypothetical protein PLD40_08870 [Kiritimatiellia bacterium]|jgi:hypothetical protein|nr:hypothetical protein [Kiritimatiellia bacterium]OQC60188.1 MAG: hypothetical protein BWX54_00283 [Verrucomicrobia bacterium ADurb.Bin018]MBP9572278.1 hypothetical protein [Kiritimatiellia bacterium]HOD99843.1 hypothetical protein [Kiritimatiellia bacterium]HOE37612.1 hypothetical protein [Kiritimatiellia bacterium]